METRNLTLLTDLYELTMMQGYFHNHMDQKVVFDAFYRRNPNGNGFAVCAGLEQVIDYINKLNFDSEAIDYLRQTGLFDEEFLSYLRGFHFSGDIYGKLMLVSFEHRIRSERKFDSPEQLKEQLIIDKQIVKEQFKKDNDD